MNRNQNHGMLKKVEVAEIFSVSQRTIDRLIASGKLSGKDCRVCTNSIADEEKLIQPK